MSVTSPMNLAMKFHGVTPRQPFFDLCFERQNLLVNACVANFFRLFRRSFPPGMAVYRGILGLRALLAIRFFPLTTSPPASNSRFAGSAILYQTDKQYMLTFAALVRVCRSDAPNRNAVRRLGARASSQRENLG
jgi:hypothetical protein